MSKKKPAAAPAKTSAEYLQNVVDRQMDMLASYRSRQDDIVRGLGEIQKILNQEGNDLVQLANIEEAKEAMTALLGRDLKQAKDRQDNYRFALDIAIKSLLESVSAGGGTAVDALSQIEILVPEAFPKSGVVVAVSGAE